MRRSSVLLAFMLVAAFSLAAIPASACETGDEGCTLGYWKNHVEDWGPTGYESSDDFDAVFGVDFFDPDLTLMEALHQGGGGEKALGRHAVAALLSAMHPGVEYYWTAAEVMAAVQAGDKWALEYANELGCPL